MVSNITTSPYTLHFTIGPVHSFVMQSRRTRDLWAGSFLLSWLSAQAMKSIVDRGGKIEFPIIDNDPLFKAIDGKTGDDEIWPRIGSLPNRYKALATIEQAEEAVSKVKDKWKALADLVWQTFLEDSVGSNEETKAIWNRQVDHFWDIAWVAGESTDDSDGAWLDQRKNWRTFWPEGDEPGDHCLLMGDWQELSGYVRARSGEREKQAEFWQQLSVEISKQVYALDNKTTLELREDERLCAPALIKRLFPVLFKVNYKEAVEVIGFAPSGLKKNDPIKNHYEAVRVWRSTAHISATPWLREICSSSETETEAGALTTYVSAVKKLAENKQAKGIIYTELINSLNDHPMAELDGRLYYEPSLLNKRSDSWGAPLDEDEDARKQLAQHLRDLQKATTEKKPSPFLAVLLMDGDSLGKLLSNPKNKSQNVSKALADFTSFVSGYHGDHVTIFAGGDDYLGLFPLNKVFDAAKVFRQKYLEICDNDKLCYEDGKPATISAAVIFAYYDDPLSSVMRDAYHLLEHTAKDKNGRDSLAVKIRRGGRGEEKVWVTKWGQECCKVDALCSLAAAYATEDERSSSYLYKLQRNYGDWLSANLQSEDGPTRDNLRQIMIAEWLVGKSQEEAKQADKHVDDLLATCLNSSKSGERFCLEGALISRFLAANGWNFQDRSQNGEK